MHNSNASCYTCEYSKYDRDAKAWCCSNENSENYGLPTEYAEFCEDYEEE